MAGGGYVPLSHAICCRPCLPSELPPDPSGRIPGGQSPLALISLGCHASTDRVLPTRCEEKAGSFVSGYSEAIKVFSSPDTYYPINTAQAGAAGGMAPRRMRAGSVLGWQVAGGRSLLLRRPPACSPCSHVGALRTCARLVCPASSAPSPHPAAVLHPRPAAGERRCLGAGTLPLPGLGRHRVPGQLRRHQHQRIAAGFHLLQASGGSTGQLPTCVCALLDAERGWCALLQGGASM